MKTEKIRPRWIVWISNPEEDKLLERPGTVEVIRPNEYDEWEHEMFVCDPASESYKEIVNDPQWGNGSDEQLEIAITKSTREWRDREDGYHKEMEEFQEWKENNKESLQRQVEVVKEVEKTVLELENLENASSEEIFKLKLDIFEKEEIQNADKEIKSKIRRSDNVIEIISIYHSVMASSIA